MVAAMPAPTTDPTPLTLRIAVWLVGAEAVALGLLAALLLYSDLTGEAQNQQGAIGVIGYTAVVAAVLAVLARALHRRRGWARGPAIVLHMLLLPFGLAIATGGQRVIGILALLAGVCGTVVLLAPATRVALGRED
jgi:hypothetical protein